MTTPAMARLQWLVDGFIDPDTLDVAAIAEAFDAVGWRDWTPEREVEFVTSGHHAASRPFEVERIDAESPHEATAILAGADGKRWSITCWVDTEAPHRIVRARTVPAPPDGLSIRLATADDGPALSALERRAPLRLGRDPITFMAFDHGDDYFAPSRLMEEVTIYVGELDGAIAGVYCGAVQRVQVDGEPKRLFLEHHVRIDPAAARGAVFWALCNFGRDRYARETDSIAFYVALENLAVRKFVSGTPSWSESPVRALIPCGPSGGDVEPEVPAITDAASILNACHGKSALFVPYTEATIADRLGRDPAQYGPSHLRRLGGAVAGVGRDLVRVTKTREGSTTDGELTVRAIAFDHGFAPGAEDDYRSLLRWSASRARPAGATHLAVFTSEHSPTYDVVVDLAEEIEPFDFWAFEIDEPASLAGHGFYVDPVYF